MTKQVDQLFVRYCSHPDGHAPKDCPDRPRGDAMTQTRTSDGIRPTCFPELGYRNDGRGLWRIYAMDDAAAIGPHYASKAELLADLQRYATEYGCEAPATEARQTCSYIDPFNRPCVLSDRHRSSHHFDAATVEPWMDEARQTVAESRDCPACGRIMSAREAVEQSVCNDCMVDGGNP